MTNKQLAFLLKHITWGFYCVVYAIHCAHIQNTDMRAIEWPDLGPWPELEDEDSD